MEVNVFSGIHMLWCTLESYIYHSVLLSHGHDSLLMHSPELGLCQLVAMMTFSLFQLIPGHQMVVGIM